MGLRSYMDAFCIGAVEATGCFEGRLQGFGDDRVVSPRCVLIEVFSPRRGVAEARYEFAHGRALLRGECSGGMAQVVPASEVMSRGQGSAYGMTRRIRKVTSDSEACPGSRRLP